MKHTHAHTHQHTLTQIMTLSLLPSPFISFFPPQTLDEMRLEQKPIKIDRRLTGSNYIDKPLQQVSDSTEG